MTIEQKTYIGDSVYVAIENGMVKLTTENGLPEDPSNTIWLEANVARVLVEWLKRNLAECER